MPHLLAVDLGVRTGLAAFTRDGRLAWYRSRNFGTAGRLRRAIPSIIDELPEIEMLVMEGGGPLGDLWEHEALRRSIATRRISAETWRARLLYARQQRSGLQAKDAASALARRTIAWSRAPRPTSLRHDAAEAILIGLWAVLDIGWLPALPPEIRVG